MTLALLLERWNERDSRYSHRKSNGSFIPLTESELDSILVYRTKETKDLDETDQRLAVMALQRWSPPMETH